jgi:acetylornithine/N-succinyldiaminopimelate aminotransferase
VRQTGLKLKQKWLAVVDAHDDLVEGIRGEGADAGLKCRISNSDVAVAARAAGLLLVPAATMSCACSRH